MEDDKMMDLIETAERLETAASALEAAAERIAEKQVAIAAEAQEYVGRITATVDSAREAELERRLEEAEARVAQLMAAADTRVAESQSAGRKTLPVGMATMLAKSGVQVDSIEAGAIDGALASLSIEQRIAVKAELMRAGLL